MGKTALHFRVVRNPDPTSRLPYLVHLPIDGGLLLKAREPWPRSARVYCVEESAGAELNDAEVVDDAAVLVCRRRGAAIDLVLDRPQLARSQFVFTQARGRPAVWWQTQSTAQRANPGARIPRGRGAGELSVVVDTRERYGWRFGGRDVAIERRALPAGDYAVVVNGEVVAAVERKTIDNLAASLSDGSLQFQLQRLGEMRHAAVVVEADYPDLFRRQPGRGSWFADTLGRLSVRYPEIPIVFAGSRRFAEEWAFRFFCAAAADHD
jgi:ERCC4 domain